MRGLVFTPRGRRVLLTEWLTRPLEATTLSGFGGKAIDGEDPIHAITRYAKAFASKPLAEVEWYLIRLERSPDGPVHYFAAIAPRFRLPEHDENATWRSTRKLSKERVDQIVPWVLDLVRFWEILPPAK